MFIMVIVYISGLSILYIYFRANDSILLALYEAIHLNRNFITALTHVSKKENLGYSKTYSVSCKACPVTVLKYQ